MFAKLQQLSGVFKIEGGGLNIWIVGEVGCQSLQIARVVICCDDQFAVEKVGGEIPDPRPCLQDSIADERRDAADDPSIVAMGPPHALQGLEAFIDTFQTIAQSEADD